MKHIIRIAAILLALICLLVLKKTYKNCENPPESFLTTGVINFLNGEMMP